MPEPLAQQPPPLDQHQQTNIGYMPQQRYDIDPVMLKHLDASDMLSRLKHMLLGHEYDEEDDEWKPIQVFVGYTTHKIKNKETGEEEEVEKEVYKSVDPLIPERTVRAIIGSLEMYLSSNTFLSILKEEARNDIMWGVCQNLGIIWLRLGNRIAPEERAMIHSTIKDAIFLGLSRAENKNTLDAISKTQQSHEIIQANPRTQPNEKEFKILGW